MSAAMTTRPARVILIEDDLWVARVNREMVEAEPGFLVVGQAESVREGLALARSLEPDLLLVDVYLPDGSGLELVHALRAERRSFEAIMITAASDVDSIQHALHDGALDYLIKPFEQSRLRQALGRYLEREAVRVGRNLTQARLDRLLGHSEDSRLPKGVDAITLEQVQGALLSLDEPQSAEEIGERVGLSRVTAWRYLEHLARTGFVTLEVAHGGVGRPIKRYRLRGRA